MFKKLLAYVLSLVLLFAPFPAVAFTQFGVAEGNIVYRATVTGLTVSAVTGTAFVDNLPAAVTTNYCDGSYSIEIYPSTTPSGRMLRGVTKTVGTSESLDATNLVTAWTNGNYDTFTSVASPDIAAAVYTTSGTQTAVSNSMVTTVGKMYKLVATWTNVAGQAPTLTGTNGFPTTTLAAGANNIYFTATGTSVVITTTNTAAASWGCTFVLKQVTAGGTSASTIVSAKAGTVYNFAVNQWVAADYNQAVYTVIIKKIRGPVEVATGSITAGNALCDSTVANAFCAPVGVDLSAYQDGKHRLDLYLASSGVLYAQALISSTAPSGLDEGSDLLAGFGLTSGFTPAGGASITGAKTYTTIGVGGAYKGYGLVQYALYKGVYTGTGGGTINLGTSGVVGIQNVYRTNVSTGGYDRVYFSKSAAGDVVITTAELYRVTMPAATGVLLKSNATDRGWIYKNALFTGNGAYTYKVMFVGEGPNDSLMIYDEVGQPITDEAGGLLRTE